MPRSSWRSASSRSPRFPGLERLAGLAWISGGELAPTVRALLRGLVATVLLLPPPIAMGATLPVVARGLV
jgi:hypothetical protein